MVLGRAREMFTKGFAAGAVTSVTVYALYSTLVKHDRHDDAVHHTRSLPTPEDSVTRTLLTGSEIFKYGIPDVGSQPRYHLNHALSYNQAAKIPHWVAEHITKQDLEGPANRKNSNFKMDPNLTAKFSSMNSDYKRSGWSRGHMAPAADNKYSQDAMDQTFYLTNILPQDINNNMNFWNLVEIYCRDLTSSFSEVRVISGPVMMSDVDESGKRHIKYEVIGDNYVAVPTHLFKVIAVEQDGNNDSTVGVGAFVVPNERIDPDQHGLRDFQVPVDILERAAGITFLPNLTRSSVVDLCSLDPCQLQSKADLDRLYIGKRIERAATLGRLESAWNELAGRNLEPTEQLHSLYKRKKRELETEAAKKRSDGAVTSS